MNLSIVGYGACMIAGYPLAGDAGFLQRAVPTLEQSGQYKVALDIVPMGGFPAARARKHFAKKVLARRPDIVLLQFGSTDASAPLRRAFLLRRLLRKDPHVREQVSTASPSSTDLLKWRLRSLASDLLCVTPTSPLEEYLNAVCGMADEARLAGCSVVMLSPFVMGGTRSNRFARYYTLALALQADRLTDVYFLDAHALLSGFPRREMLLRDGFHLSPRAHEELAAALGRLLAQVAQDHFRRPRVSVDVKAAS
ncbi:MAG: SGNH/GDSL hydrolase family protein [Verrucomicrobiae bacterium]|nr:SGNH/GDSL hydrolase family protein [Verrucomicrobiae bacterium]